MPLAKLYDKVAHHPEKMASVLRECSTLLASCQWRHEGERVASFVKRIANTSHTAEGMAGGKVAIQSRRKDCVAWLVEHTSAIMSLPDYPRTHLSPQWEQVEFPLAIGNTVERFVICPVCKGFGASARLGKPACVSLRNPRWHEDMSAHILRDHAQDTWFLLSVHEMIPCEIPDLSRFIILRNVQFAPTYVPLAEIRIRATRFGNYRYRFIPSPTPQWTDITDEF